MLVSIYRIRTLERNYPNSAVSSQCSITVLTKTMLIITCRMFSRCNNSEDFNCTLCETFSCVNQLTSLVVLLLSYLSRRHCKCYTNSVCILSPVALQLRAPPKVSARAPAHRSYHFRGVKLKSCIKKIHHNLYISKQANVRIKHADTEGASHKKFGTDARVQ